MQRNRILALAFLVALLGWLSPGLRAREFYVSPQGSPQGKGSLQSPWDLQTALNQPPVIKPGDTIWLRGGVYQGAFVSRLSGTASMPIRLCQYPGERATIDRAGSDATAQPALTVKGSWTWYWGFEITNSNENRNPASAFTGAVRPWRGDGIDVYAPDNRLINLIIHDCGAGIYDKQDRTEIYGCLIYFNGNNHFEHGMYLGNASGIKRVADNIIFDQAGFGIHCFSGSTSTSQRGLTLEGNAVFNSGTLWRGGNTVADIIVGGVAGVPAASVVLDSNFVYAAISESGRRNGGVRLGYADRTNTDLRVTTNYIVSREPLRIDWWQSVVCTHNLIYTPGPVVELRTPTSFQRERYQWDDNAYRTLSPTSEQFSFDGSTRTRLVSWKQQTGFDQQSRLNHAAGFSAPYIFLRRNAYEKGRATLVVFNWPRQSSIPVDLSSVLAVGDGYEIRDAQNYFAVPIASGIFRGSLIRLPMTMQQTAMPIGASFAPRHTAPEFAVFILQKAADLKARSSIKLPPSYSLTHPRNGQSYAKPLDNNHKQDPHELRNG